MENLMQIARVFQYEISDEIRLLQRRISAMRRKSVYSIQELDSGIEAATIRLENRKQMLRSIQDVIVRKHMEKL